MTLSGLEKKLKTLFSASDRVHMVVYADDFIVTAAYKELLEVTIIPIIEEFLKERGLEISQEKSKIFHIAQGFNFLGFNIRKYDNGKVFTKPAKASIKSFLNEVRKVIKSNYAVKAEDLIKLLNPKIIGRTNYFRNSVASRVFSYIDCQIFNALWRWMKHRHPNHSKSWICNKYFRSYGTSNWQLFAMVKDKDGQKSPIYLTKACKIAIRRHLKIKGMAHPFNPEFKEYFKLRKALRKTRRA